MGNALPWSLSKIPKWTHVCVVKSRLCGVSLCDHENVCVRDRESESESESERERERERERNLPHD
jgi:hypothetical protein